VDTLTRIVVPGGATEQWLGSELATPPYKLTADPTWIAGSVPGDYLLLNANNEGGGAPPNTGQGWPEGRHRLTFKIQGSPVGFNLALTVKWRVVSVGGGGAGSEVASGTRTFTSGLQAGTFTETLEFDSAAATSYQPQVVLTAYTSGELRAWQIDHSFVPYLAQNEQAHTEPDNGIVHKRDSSGNLVSVLSTEGSVPLMVPPGLTAIFVIPLDVPKPGYTEPESVKARTVTVTATGSPRYLG
jgi:hypothetical protein